MKFPNGLTVSLKRANLPVGNSEFHLYIAAGHAMSGGALLTRDEAEALVKEMWRALEQPQEKAK